MTTPRSLHRLRRALRLPRSIRGRTLALGASLVTVLALVQLPVCAMGMDGCMLGGAGDTAAGAGHDAVATGDACPLSGDGTMTCCPDEPAEQVPATPDTSGKDTRAQVAAQASACATPPQLPLVTDEAAHAATKAAEPGTDVPLYTLHESYLN